jgi:hypothetical protein
MILDSLHIDDRDGVLEQHIKQLRSTERGLSCGEAVLGNDVPQFVVAEGCELAKGVSSDHRAWQAPWQTGEQKKSSGINGVHEPSFFCANKTRHLNTRTPSRVGAGCSESDGGTCAPRVLLALYLTTMCSCPSWVALSAGVGSVAVAFEGRYDLVRSALAASHRCWEPAANRLPGCGGLACASRRRRHGPSAWTMPTDRSDRSSGVESGCSAASQWQEALCECRHRIRLWSGWFPHAYACPAGSVAGSPCSRAQSHYRWLQTRAVTLRLPTAAIDDGAAPAERLGWSQAGIWWWLLLALPHGSFASCLAELAQSIHLRLVSEQLAERASIPAANGEAVEEVTTRPIIVCVDLPMLNDTLIRTLSVRPPPHLRLCPLFSRGRRERCWHAQAAVKVCGHVASFVVTTRDPLLGQWCMEAQSCEPELFRRLFVARLSGTPMRTVESERLAGQLSEVGDKTAAGAVDLRHTLDEGTRIAALDFAVGGDVEDIDTVSRCCDELGSAGVATGSTAAADESTLIAACVERLQQHRCNLLVRSICIPPETISQRQQQPGSESVIPLCEIERIRSELFDQSELVNSLLLWKGLLMLTVDPPLITLGTQRRPDGRTLGGIVQELRDEQLASGVLSALVASGHVDVFAASGDVCVSWDDDVSRRMALVLSEKTFAVPTPCGRRHTCFYLVVMWLVSAVPWLPLGMSHVQLVRFSKGSLQVGSVCRRSAWLRARLFAWNLHSV